MAQDRSAVRGRLERSAGDVRRVLNAEAFRRALEGVEEPVFWQGHELGWIRKSSDTLLIFTTKGAMPERYRENVNLKLNGKMEQKRIPASLLEGGRDEIEVQPCVFRIDSEPTAFYNV